MKDFKLTGGPNSPFARKVVLALAAKGLLDRTELIRPALPVMSIAINPPLLALNPLGKVPVLEVRNGPTLFETDLICEYLDAHHIEPPLIPPSGTARWQALQWNGLGTGGLEMLILWRGERLRPEAIQSAETIAVFDAKLNAILSAMHKELPALAQAPYGLAQIAWMCFLGYLDFRFADLDWRARWPNGVGWFDTMMQRRLMEATLPDCTLADAPVWHQEA